MNICLFIYLFTYFNSRGSPLLFIEFLASLPSGKTRSFPRKVQAGEPEVSPSSGLTPKSDPVAHHPFLRRPQKGRVCVLFPSATSQDRTDCRWDLWLHGEGITSPSALRLRILLPVIFPVSSQHKHRIFPLLPRKLPFALSAIFYFVDAVSGNCKFLNLVDLML